MFVASVSEDRKCCLCKLVVDNPVQGPCKHVFCSGCVLPWVVEKGVCPFQCQTLNIGDLQNVLALRELVLNMKVFCGFKTNGCTEEPRLRDTVQHMQMCDYRQVVCENPGCEARVMARDFEEHSLTLCDFRAVGSCEKGCEAVLRHNDVNHSCVDYLKAKVSEHEELVKNLGEELGQLKQQLQTREKELLSRIKGLQKRLQMQGIKLINQTRNYETLMAKNVTECATKVINLISSV